MSEFQYKRLEPTIRHVRPLWTGSATVMERGIGGLSHVVRVYVRMFL